MEKEELKLLFKRYNDGTATEEEKALLEAWYLQHNEADEISYHQIQAVKAKVFRELPGNESAFFRIGTRLLAAAVIIGILITAGIHFLPIQKTPSKPVASDIPPGTNKAILKLGNGRQINLSDAKNGQLAAQNGIQVYKNSAGQVTYQITANSSDRTLNTIETPKGGRWKIALPDGTQVWLNAATSLTFPASFAALKNREVTLHGEAYFEVAKDKLHPFIVTSATQRVEVLGTHFNINGYQDEAVTKTTLLEGRVKISLPNSSATAILKPGEQAVNNTQKIAVGAVDTGEAIAWKEGYFQFDDEPISSVMRKLERWYNIDVSYAGTGSDERLNGKVLRSKNISQVIQVLEATKTVHFKLEGRRITVMK